MEKIDYPATYKNCITGVSLEKAAAPTHFDTDREAIEVGLGSIGLIRPGNSKIIRIQNTNRLEMIDVSAAYGDDLEHRPDLEIVRPPQPMVFDAEDNLV